MTPTTIFEIALDRVGLSASSTVFKDRARQYFNMVQDDMASRARWAWLFKQTTFATVASTQSYNLASDCLEPLAFRDQTNDVTLGLRTSETTDMLDPDDDETGLPQFVVPTGWSTSDVYTVLIHPIPDDAYTIAYRYYAYLSDITSGDDDTDYGDYVPQWLQPALVHGVAHKFYDEKGAHESAQVEQAEYERVLARGLARNGLQGNRPTRVGRVRELNRRFDFVPQEGSLS